MGRLTKETDGEDLTLTFAYDARNRLVRVEDGQGARVSYRYDARGNRIGEEQVIRSGEDKEGNESGRAVLKTIKYLYDKAGRLTEKKEILDSGLAGAAGTTAVTAVTTYTYDENGNRIRIEYSAQHINIPNRIFSAHLKRIKNLFLRDFRC